MASYLFESEIIQQNLSVTRILSQTFSWLDAEFFRTLALKLDRSRIAAPIISQIPFLVIDRSLSVRFVAYEFFKIISGLGNLKMQRTIYGRLTMWFLKTMFTLSLASPIYLSPQNAIASESSESVAINDLRLKMSESCIKSDLKSSDALGGGKNKSTSKIDQIKVSFDEVERLFTNTSSLISEYELNFDEPVCESKAKVEIPDDSASPSQNKLCKYISYHHQQIHALPKVSKSGQEIALLDLVNTYTSHVRSPQKKGVGSNKKGSDLGEWTYYHIKDVNTGKVERVDFNATAYEKPMKPNQTYITVKCIKTPKEMAFITINIDVCNAFQYTLKQLESGAYVLLTTTFDLPEKKCRGQLKNIPDSKVNIFALNGYTSFSVIKELKDTFVIIDIGGGYSLNKDIVASFSDSEGQKSVKDLHALDFRQLSARITENLGITPRFANKNLGKFEQSGTSK